MAIPTKYALCILDIRAASWRHWILWDAARGWFWMPCLPGDALCGLPGNPSACDGNTAISLAAPFKLVLLNETNKKRKRPERK